MIQMVTILPAQAMVIRQIATKMKIEYIRGHNYTVDMLTEMKFIVSIEYRDGRLVGRYGTPPSSLTKMAKRLDGVD